MCSTTNTKIPLSLFKCGTYQGRIICLHLFLWISKTGKGLSKSVWHIKVKKKLSYYKQISLNISIFLYQCHDCNYMEDKTKLPNNATENLSRRRRERKWKVLRLCLEIKCFVWVVWFDRNFIHCQTVHSSCLGNQKTQKRDMKGKMYQMFSWREHLKTASI